MYKIYAFLKKMRLLNLRLTFIYDFVKGFGRKISQF